MVGSRLFSPQTPVYITCQKQPPQRARVATLDIEIAVIVASDSSRILENV
jgi:hypothetical protein